MEAWAKEIQHGEINMTRHDLNRSAQYAHDLITGLAKVENFPIGVTVFGSARLGTDSPWYQKARDLGARLAQNGHPVITGGGPGIMEAANRGAFESHGRSVGFNIHLATEQDLNPYTTDNMEFHYFFSRKLMMTLAAKVYVFFPGGFGTMDEFSEILELKHTGKNVDTPIFLVGKDFWRGLDEWYGGPMSDMNLIETGRTGELRELDLRDDNSNENNDLASNLAETIARSVASSSAQRNPAADEKISRTTKAARDLYTITDNVEDIVAAANQVEPRAIDDRLRELTRSGAAYYDGSSTTPRARS